MNVVHCFVCKKMPHEINEYVELAKTEGYPTPEQFVIGEEGTFNSRSGRFYCTACYINVGMPSGKAP